MDGDERKATRQPRKQEAAEERRQRLAAALRENLRRRKSQARARAQTADPVPKPEPDPPATTAPDQADDGRQKPVTSHSRKVLVLKATK